MNSSSGSIELMSDSIHKYVEMRCEGCDDSFCSWLYSRVKELRYKQKIELLLL